MTLEPDGSFLISVGMEEMGQGLNTALHIIAAEALAVDYDCITVVSGNTALYPDTGSSTASRCTYIGGNAVLNAIEQFWAVLRQQLAGHDIQVAKDGISLDGQAASWQEIAALLPESTLTAAGQYAMPTSSLKIQIGLHYIHSHVCQVVGVQVDTRTGKVDILETEILPAAGAVINRLGYEGQAEGGVVMTMGYALMEDFRLDAAQQPLTRNLQTYLLPTIKDMPAITVTPVEDPEASGPHGAKGLGEPVTIPGAPAIINAIYDAVGVRIYDLPASPERVLLSLEQD